MFNRGLKRGGKAMARAGLTRVSEYPENEEEELSLPGVYIGMRSQ